MTASQTSSRRRPPRGRSKSPTPGPTTVDKAVDALREKIKEGFYAPGQRLVEADLTQSLGISRGPLREAMWRLAGEGLTTIEPNRGAMVRKLSREEVENIYSIREMLEGLAARLAAENIGRLRGKSRLQSANGKTVKAARDNDAYAYMRANEAFHELIVEFSSNAELATLLSQLRLSLFRLLFRRMLNPSTMRTSIADHKEIARAILECRPEAAERAMRKHIRHSRKALGEFSDAVFD